MSGATRLETKEFGNLETSMIMAYRALSEAEFHARRVKMTATADALRQYADDVMKMGQGLYFEGVWNTYVGEDHDEV